MWEWVEGILYGLRIADAAKKILPAPKVVSRNTAKILTNCAWRGEALELETDGTYTTRYAVDWTFYQRSGKLMCDSIAYWRVGLVPKREEFKLTCRIVQDRLFQIDFVNGDDRIVNFGSEILELSNDGRTFSGKFVSFVADRSIIISGKIEARCVDK